MALDRATRQAIARYGPSVNRQARRRYGISGQQLLARLTQGESGGRRNAVSSAGARGLTQFMPATRAEYKAKYGVDPWKNPDQAEHATAIYLKNAGGDLQAYNPGMASYTDYILGQRVKLGKTPNVARGGAGGGSSTRTVTTTTPGVDNHKARATLLLQYLQNPTRPGAIMDLASGVKQLQDVAPTTTTRTIRTRGVSSPRSPRQLTRRKGVSNFEGTPVADWIKPILVSARKDGVKFKLSSGYRSDAEQTRIYNSGVRPAAVPRSMGGKGSNHEFKAFPGGAVDVGQGAQALAAWLKHSKYRNLLVYAGAKDPVHFSHPHNGSY